MPPLPVNPKTPPTDSTLTFGPGAVASLTSGQKKAAPKPKKQRDMSHSSSAPTPSPDVGFREAPTAPGMIQPGNITTTPKSAITVEKDGQFVVIPKTKSDNAALNQFTKTGQHLGIFDSQQAADSFAQTLHEPVPTIPKGVPIPALQQFGVNMGIYDVNSEVDKLTQVYREKFGHSPPPGLVFDVLKAQGRTGPVDYNKLFGIPTSAREAQVAGSARFGSGDDIANLPIVVPKIEELVKGLQESITLDNHQKVSFTHNFMGGASNPAGMENQIAFWNEYKDSFDAALADPKQRDIVVKGLMEMSPFNALAHKFNPTVTPEIAARAYARGKLSDLRVATAGAPPGVLKYFSRALEQISVMTTDMPYGAYQLVRGANLDLYDLQTAPLHALAQSTGLDRFGIDVRSRPSEATRTVKNIWRMLQQVENDVLHPGTNPGYLIADIWAAATLGAGSAARVGAAREAVGIRATARALVVKGEPAWTEAGFGTYWQALPLSDTAIVRWLQLNTPVVNRAARQARFLAEQTDGYGGAHQQLFYDKVASLSKTIAKTRSKDLQIQMAIDLAPLEEMNKLNKANAWSKEVFKETVGNWGFKRWKNETVENKLALEKSIQLLLSDDPNPFAMFRAFHENQLQAAVDMQRDHTQATRDALIGDENSPFTERNVEVGLEKNKQYQRRQGELMYAQNAHKAQLAAIDLAEKFILDPPPQFKAILDRVHELTAFKEDMYRELSGLSQEKLDEARAIQTGGFPRGERIIDLGDGRRGYSDIDPTETLNEIASRQRLLKNAEIRLSKSKGAARLHPSRTDFAERVEQDQALVDRHNKALGAHERRLEEIRESATPVEPIIGADGKVSDAFLKRDVERLAEREGIPEVRWGGSPDWIVNLRSENAYARREFTGEPVAIEVAEPGKGYFKPAVSKKLNNMMFDKHFNRDNTNDYLAALHEIGHKVFQRDEGSFPQSKAWIDEVHRRNPPTVSELDDGVETVADRLSKIEEEAAATLWAIKNSAEPLRSMVYIQLLKFWDSYMERMPDVMLGPAGEELLALADNGTALGDAIAELRMGTPGSAKVPFETERHRGEKKGMFGRSLGRFGISKGKFEIHPWTGDSLMVGDYRIDVTGLLNEQIPNTYRAFTKRVQWQHLWDNAVPERITENHVPIRDIASIPEELRNIVMALERAKVDPRYADMITDKNLEALQKFLYPTEQEIRDGYVPTEHVKFVDKNLVLDKVGPISTEAWQSVDKIFSMAFSVPNDLMRFFLIYGTPAYALNALGSAALLMIHAGPMGFLEPRRVMRSIRSEQIYGPELKRVLDRLSGQTHTASLQTEQFFWSKANTKLQEGWSALTDTWFRRAAVIHELKRHGLLDENMTNEEMLAAIKDKANAKKVNQAAQTARKAMIDFNSLTWPERAIMRHLVFVYSFIRGSGIWSLRYLRDHGFQADVLGQAGRNREQNIDDLIGKMPDWFMRAGYFAVKPDTIYNPIQWNMPGMLSQIATPLASIFGHVPYSSAAQLWGPGAVFLSESQTGIDPQGRALPGGGGNLQKAMYQLYQETFIGQLKHKGDTAKRDAANPLPPEPVSVPEGGKSFGDPVGSAMARESAGLNQSVFRANGFWNDYAPVIARSGVPRNVNAVAGAARYWRDLKQTDIQAYHKHELDMVHAMIKRQQEVVGHPISSEALRAVDTVAHVSQAIYDFQEKHKGELFGHSPSDKQITQITLETLSSEGHIKDKAKWAKEIRNATDPAVIKAIRYDLFVAAGATAWRKWVEKVNAVDAYAQPKYDVNVQRLSDLGLGSYKDTVKAPREQRWAYGRAAQDIITKAAELQAGIPVGDPQIKRQEWIRYVNENDHEVKIGGKTYPSPFALEFASKNPDVQTQALAAYTKRKPSTLTALQTQLITGTRPDPIVTQGWETLATWMKARKEKLGFGQNPEPGLRDYYGKFLAAKSKEFKKAWDFDHQPLVKRMISYQTIKNSPNKPAWDYVLQNTSDRYDQLVAAYKRDDGTVNMSLVKEAWKLDVPKLVESIHSKYGNTTFMSELHLYTGATNPETADAYLGKFLNKLVAP